ncbi:MAG TPA: asparagine synthetase B, partial [Puia sp.]|nr:asparagine synthetase B [Puia sp.]
IGYEPPQSRWMENKDLQGLIQSAKTKLVDEKILKPAVLTKKNQPQDAHAADNYEWRYLIAATCLQTS